MSSTPRGKKRPACPSTARRAIPPAASRFAALGDATRLSLLATLSRARPHSISQLARGSHLTRQAITKHLRVLERARIVRCMPSGRERLYSLDPASVADLRSYLDRVSAAWDASLHRLKAHVESGPRR